MAFKTKEQLEARSQFLAEANQGELEIEKMDSIKQLSKMTVDELVYRWDCIHAQSQIYSWFLYMTIRDKIPSDLEYGQYLDTLRKINPDHPLCTTKQQRLNTYVNTARFLLAHRIKDISNIGIQPTALHMIAAPRNKEVASVLLRKLKHGNHPIDTVKKIIATVREKHGLDVKPEPEEPEQLEANKEPVAPYTLKVEGGVVANQTDWTEDEKSIIDGESVRYVEPEAEPEAVQPAFTFAGRSASATALKMGLPVHKATLGGDLHRRQELLLELSEMDMSDLTQEQRIEEMMLLNKSYRMADLRLIADHQEIIKRYMPTYSK